MQTTLTEVIKHYKKNNLTRLDLGNLALTAIPEEIKELRNLEILILSSEFQTWQKDKENIRKSRWIAARSQNIGRANEITNIPNWFGTSFPNLKRLVLAGGSSDKWGLRDLSNLAGLTQLEELDISNTSVEDLNFLKGMSNLRHMLCYRTNVKSLEPIANLSHLEVLQAYNTKVTALPEFWTAGNLQQLVINQTDVSSLAPIRGFKKLTRLDVKRTKIDDRSVDVLAGFKELQILDLLETNITRLPKLEMPDLLLLDLRKTKIKDVRPLLPLLEKGMEIQEVEHGIARDSIVVDRSIPFQNPGLEIILSGRKQLLDFLSASYSQGMEYLYEAKIVIVGAGESGKTTLVRKLKDPSHVVPNKSDKRTEGILIEQYSFKNPHKIDGSERYADMIAHIWDFGGQLLYYTTHQLFLTGDTLYILLNDNRKNDTDFYYWLNIVTLRAGEDCPILTVFNAKEGSQRTISLENKIFDPFGGLIRKPVDVDFAKSDDLWNNLIATIQSEFCKLAVLGRKLPANWVKVRKALLQIPDDYIMKERFRKICEENGVKDESQMETLLEVFHKLGIVLHFSKINEWLEDLIILNSKWCTDAVYKALDKEFIQEQRGKFTRDRLSQIWSEARYRGRERDLLDIMIRFNLCYRVDGIEDTYIAPQLLDLKAKYLPEFPAENVLRYRYRYEFMPSGIVTQFIAKMSPYIYQDYVWRDGVTLRWEEDTVAEVIENQLTREINIRIAGPGKKVRLIDVQDKLNEVKKAFKGLKETGYILCPCKDCKNAEEPTEFKLEDVVAYAENNAKLVCRQGDKFELMDAQGVLDGIYENKGAVIAEVEEYLKQGDLKSLRAAAQSLAKLPDIRIHALVIEGNCNQAMSPKIAMTTDSEDERNKIIVAIIRLLDSLKK